MEPPATEVLSVLKKDSFGRIELLRRNGELLVRRVPCGGSIPGSGIVGRWLARREQRALERLGGVGGVPSAVKGGKREFLRTFLPGSRLDRAGRPSDDYFDRLEGIVGEIHQRGIAHNDLEKAANLLLLEDGSPAVLDFQLAVCARPRGWLKRGGRVLRTMQREDLRHLSKQKARRRPDLLTGEDRRRLASKSLFARGWAAVVKPVYLLVTRGLLRTADREGEGPARPETRRG